MHGPVTLVAPGYPLLMLMPTDEAADGLRALAADLVGKRAGLYVADLEHSGVVRLPALAPDHPETDAVCLAQTFYGMMLRLAELRGLSADRPRHLQKVTRTR
jgi:glucosamine--fructose-6-phosphate aminotransferase (isomerizing)